MCNISPICAMLTFSQRHTMALNHLFCLYLLSMLMWICILVTLATQHCLLCHLMNFKHSSSGKERKENTNKPPSH